MDGFITRISESSTKIEVISNDDLIMTDTLFYDGQCPLCAGEIKYLRRLKDNALELVDIHSPTFATHSEGLERKQMLAILHLKTDDNLWLRGLDATLRAWRHTRFGWLLSPLRWPGIKQIADWLYLRWARKRACRLGYSQDCLL